MCRCGALWMISTRLADIVSVAELSVGDGTSLITLTR